VVLTRQKLPVLDRTTLAPAAGTARGAYVLIDAGEGSPELILIATGSEVSLALAAHRQLAAEGIRGRVVSMPSWELFEAQPAEYRRAVLPPAVRAGSAWKRVRRSGGNATSGRGARSSAWTASARRRRDPR